MSMEPAEHIATLGGVHHVALRAADFEASLRFYREGLGFAVARTWTEDGLPAAMLDAGGGSYVEVFGGGTPGRHAEGTLLHFALRTADCDGSLRRARAAGARVTSEPETIEIAASPEPFTARLAYCTGPNGEIIEFIQSSDL